MHKEPESYESGEGINRQPNGAMGHSFTRRSVLGAGALMGLAALAFPSENAFAWSSWTNATSPILKKTGMGDCVHEDLVQISYARVIKKHAKDPSKASLLNPWAGTIQSDARYADIAGDTVDRGEGKTFAGADDLAARLYRENLAYLRIGSFWNDAAANTLADFALSCYHANSIPKFSGKDYYEGAWDVGQHLVETNKKNEESLLGGRDALVQFTMNDRNNFIHGMLSSTASHSSHLKQSEVKKFALQWLGVAYEYARTGEVQAVTGVTKDQAQNIFDGFIDTYGQLDDKALDMRVSLKVSNNEASLKIPHRRLRLRALGMMCHTLEDFWCPAHTCRTYNESDGIAKNTILAFSNYKRQNGNKPPMWGYHIPFDRYAVSDANNSTNWREALTRGKGEYVGTETLANVLAIEDGYLENADTYFNTLGMNETIECITQLFEYMYEGTAWDDGVCKWVDEEIMPTHFDGNGQSYVCDAGRRGLHTPTFIMAPIKSMKRAYRKMGLSANYDEVMAAAKSYDAWQKGAHLFYSGKFNTEHSKYVTSGHEGDSIWADSVGEDRLVDLADKLHAGYSSLSADRQSQLLSRVGFNGCHNMVSVVDMIRGMLQEFSIDLRGSMRPSSDDTMKKLSETGSFFKSGLNGGKTQVAKQSSGLLAASVAYADEGDAGDEHYETASMAIEDFAKQSDGSYIVAVRDMDSLDTSVMTVPANTPGIDKMKEGLANLTITYTLDVEFEDDLDYRYIVTDIDYSDEEQNVYLVTGTVKSTSDDKKSLVLDLNGISDYTLSIGDGLLDIPSVGQYICARYSSGKSGLDLVGYDELDAPGELVKVTYSVAEVYGTSLLLEVVDAASDATDGYHDYMQVEYGSADVRVVPQVGYKALVYYHDEAYGDTTDVDEHALATAAVSGGFPITSTQSDEDDINDSANVPGYLEPGYDANPTYGNEVFHVANVIVGLSDEAEKAPDAANNDESSSSSNSETPAQPAAAPASSATPKTGASKTTSSTTPKTADPFSGLNGLLSVAAAAGAVMTAYSARRVANEQGEQEEK